MVDYTISKPKGFHPLEAHTGFSKPEEYCSEKDKEAIFNIEGYFYLRKKRIKPVVLKILRLEGVN